MIFFTVKGQGKRGYTCKKKTNSGWRVVGEYIFNWDLVKLKDRFHSQNKKFFYVFELSGNFQMLHSPSFRLIMWSRRMDGTTTLCPGNYSWTGYIRSIPKIERQITLWMHIITELKFLCDYIHKEKRSKNLCDVILQRPQKELIVSNFNHILIIKICSNLNFQTNIEVNTCRNM